MRPIQLAEWVEFGHLKSAVTGKGSKDGHAQTLVLRFQMSIPRFQFFFYVFVHTFFKFDFFKFLV